MKVLTLFFCWERSELIVESWRLLLSGQAVVAVTQNKTRLDAGLNDLFLYDLATTRPEYTSHGLGVPVRKLGGCIQNLSGNIGQSLGDRRKARPLAAEISSASLCE